MTPNRLLLPLLLLALLVPAAQAQTPSSFARVDSLTDAGSYEQALDLLQQRREQQPADAEVLWRLSQTYVDLGEATSGDAQAAYYEQAIEAAQAAVEADSQNAQAHVTLAVAAGRVALNSGTRRKVELSRSVKEHVDRALELDPENEMAYHVRGRWNYGVSDLNWIERAVVKTVYGGLPEASFEQAARDLEKAASLGQRVVHHLELGRTYMKLGRDEEAREQLQYAIEMPPSDPMDPAYQEEARELLDEL